MRLSYLLATIYSLTTDALSQHTAMRGPDANKVWKPSDTLQPPNIDSSPAIKNNIASDATVYTNFVKNVDIYRRQYKGMALKPQETKSISYENVNKRHWPPTPNEGDKPKHSSYSKINKVSNSKNEKAFVQDKNEQRNAILLKSRSSNSLSDIIGRTHAKPLAWRGSHKRDPRMNQIPVAGGVAIQKRSHLLFKPGLKDAAMKSIKASNFEALWQHVLSAGRTYPIRIYSLNKHFGRTLRKKSLTFDSIEELIPVRFVRNPMYIAFDKKKGAKRKVKFSSWPGKKFPPIIGPMWTPAKQADNDWKLKTNK